MFHAKTYSKYKLQRVSDIMIFQIMYNEQYRALSCVYRIFETDIVCLMFPCV